MYLMDLVTFRFLSSSLAVGILIVVSVLHFRRSAPLKKYQYLNLSLSRYSKLWNKIHTLKNGGSKHFGGEKISYG